MSEIKQQLTVEQAAGNHARRSCVTHVELKRTAQEIDNIAFQAGAEWQKEQFAQLFMDLNYQIDLISPFDVSEAGLLAQKIRTILKKFDV